ncbi:c-type cytochrome [Sphingomonas xinjiangensis]|uniref:Cytochrome c n=1 Tax=Sphingomonas xinjiangensis TaxID=643568 RepID=A0A840YKF0_9SPHN|nr:c-type cytochrome [Sphingomonas xinjiangensis]MBB5709616.1 cytochrome c [Sphingomonas xinjiangensis]
MRVLVLAAALLLGGCGDDKLAERRAAAGANPTLGDYLRVSDAARGRRLFGQCAACHTVRVGGPDLNGPNLHGVVGRGIAQGRGRVGYSAALQAKQGAWTVEALDAWLASPQRFAPGTSMRFGGVRDPLDRADVIAFLRAN